MPYPTGNIIATQRIQAVYWLLRLDNHVAVTIRYASVPAVRRAPVSILLIGSAALLWRAPAALFWVHFTTFQTPVF